MLRKGLLGVVLSLFLFSCADINLAKKLYSEGKLKEAKEELKPLAEKGFPQAYYLLGKIYAQEKQYLKAEEYLKKAFNQGIKRAARDLGILYYKIGKPKEALKWLEIAKESGDATAGRLEVLISLKSGLIREKEIKRLEKLALNDPEIAERLGDYFSRKNNIQKAIYFYKLSLSLGNKKAGVKLAKLFLKERKFKEALKLLLPIYEKTKDQEIALVIGKTYERWANSLKEKECYLLKVKSLKEYLKHKLSLKEKKAILYRKALDWYLKVKTPEGIYLTKRLEWKLKGNRCGEFQVIASFAKRGVKEAISDLQNLYYSGMCSSYGSEVSVENNAYLQGLKGKATETTTEAQLLYRRALGLVNINRQEAIELLKKACQYGYTPAELELAFLEFRENPKLFGGIIYYYAKEKRVPKAMYLLAFIYLNYGEKTKALYWLKRASDLRYIPAVREYVKILLKEGKFNEAIRILSKYAKDKYCFAFILLGKIYEGEYPGFKDVSLKEAIKFYKLGAVNECPEAYYRLAYLYFNLGKIKNAEKYALKYILIRKEQAKGYLLLTKIYLELGEKRKAARALERAIEIGYRPSPSLLLSLIPYLKRDVLLSKKSIPSLLVLAATKFHNLLNDKERICFLKIGVEKEVPGSPIYLLKTASVLEDDGKSYVAIRALRSGGCREVKKNLKERAAELLKVIKNSYRNHH